MDATVEALQLERTKRQKSATTKYLDRVKQNDNFALQQWQQISTIFVNVMEYTGVTMKKLYSQWQNKEEY